MTVHCISWCLNKSVVTTRQSAKTLCLALRRSWWVQIRTAGKQLEESSQCKFETHAYARHTKGSPLTVAVQIEW